MSTRAVIYVRQSIARDDSVSPELQRTAAEQHCTARGYEVVDVVEDLGISGRTWKRPGVQQVMGMVDDGKADVIVLWKWSRLSRSRLDWAVAMDRVEQAGGRIESATEPIDVSTASGRLARGMLAEFAAFESERIGEQWKETHARRRRMGLPAQGGERYGYTRDRDTYEPHPEQAEMVRWMYDRYLGGAGMTAIAGELNAAGSTSRRGKPWSKSTVKALLDSGFAAGLLVSGEGETQVWAPGVHPALIDEATWTAFRRARRQRVKVHPRVIEPRYPLTGLIRCGDCGWSMVPTHAGTGVPGHGYICSQFHTTKAVRCVTIARHLAEAAVLDFLRGLADEVEASSAADAARDKATARARLSTRGHAARVIELDRRLAELTKQLVAGVVPADTYATVRDELTAERAAAQTRLDDAEAATAAPAAGTRAVARSLLDTWDVLEVRRKRDLIATLVRQVQVHPPERRHRRSRPIVIPAWESAPGSA